MDAKSGLQNTGELTNALFSKGLACYRFTAFDRLAMSVLVLGGRYDGAIGMEPLKALAAMLPDATFIEYENSAHFPYLEEREKFVAYIGGDSKGDRVKEAIWVLMTCSEFRFNH